jgi:hypothetical protein
VNWLDCLIGSQGIISTVVDWLDYLIGPLTLSIIGFTFQSSNLKFMGEA